MQRIACKALRPTRVPTRRLYDTEVCNLFGRGKNCYLHLITEKSSVVRLVTFSNISSTSKIPLCDANLYSVRDPACQQRTLAGGNGLSIMEWGLFSWKLLRLWYVYKLLWLINSTNAFFLMKYTLSWMQIHAVWRLQFYHSYQIPEIWTGCSTCRTFYTTLLNNEIRNLGISRIVGRFCKNMVSISEACRVHDTSYFRSLSLPTI